MKIQIANAKNHSDTAMNGFCLLQWESARKQNNMGTEGIALLCIAAVAVIVGGIGRSGVQNLPLHTARRKKQTAKAGGGFAARGVRPPLKDHFDSSNPQVIKECAPISAKKTRHSRWRRDAGAFDLECLEIIERRGTHKTSRGRDWERESG